MRTFAVSCILTTAPLVGAQQPSPAGAKLRLSNSTNLNCLALSPDGKILAGSPLARMTLEDLSRGHAEDWIPEEARAAVKRFRP